jgi:probable F420-dependent oxidoreductase
MKVGVIYPQAELPTDAGAVRAYTHAVESLGFSHILVYDHVIGANRASRPGWKGFYDLDSIFHEPLTLFSFMAGITSKIRFISGVVILPQRQTVLVAKQTACLDVLSHGRLSLGVGTGWNEVEYEALGADFSARGKVFEDQIGVLRALWTERAVTIKTPYHTVTDAGINPLPVQRPIPIWFGGGGTHPVWNTPNVEKVVRRIARLGDGWLTTLDLEEGKALLPKFRDYCREYGREPNAVGIDALMFAWDKTKENWTGNVEAWHGLGATQMSISTMRDNLAGVDAHLRRLEEVRHALPKQYFE